MTAWLCVDDAEPIVKGAFAEWARRYRATRPALYKKVDQQLQRAHRQPRSPSLGTVGYAGSMAECPRCGDDFPTFGTMTVRFCSPECHDEHRAWCKRTGRPFHLRKDVS